MINYYYIPYSPSRTPYIILTLNQLEEQERYPGLLTDTSIKYFYFDIYRSGQKLTQCSDTFLSYGGPKTEVSFYKLILPFLN